MMNGDTTSHRLQAPPPASCSSVPEPGPTSVTLSTVVPRAAEARPSPSCITPSFTWCGRAGEAGGINISRGLCLVLALPYLKHLYCEPITRLIPYEHQSGSRFPDRVSGQLLRRSDSSSLSTRLRAAAKSCQSCPALCDPIDGSPPGSRPWDSPGKNTGVGCHVLLQCMEVKGESEVSQACLTLHHPGTGSSNSILPACINPPTLSWSFQFAHECAAICLLSGDKKIPNSSWPRFPAFPVSRPPNGLSPSEVRSPQVVLQTRTTPLLWRCLLPAA